MFAPDLSRVIALEVVVNDSVEATDTLRARAILHTAGGDSFPGDTLGAVVYWASFDTTVLAVVDSTRGTFTGRGSGTTNLQAWMGSLRSAPILITVTAAADTLVALSPLVDTVSVGSGDSLSDSLEVEVASITVASNPPTVAGLVGRPVTFALTGAPPGAGAVLVTSDTTHTGVTVDTLSTNSSGLAAIQVRYLGGGTLPDSIVVTARAQRAVGTPLAGSPVSFVVHLAP
ncbi:MAG TPA: hypothetical protein VN848_08850 [Gemmatimonadales bacterium]|nr:hypothetical protein [Gemmatimonadales bacterium]